MKKKRFLALLLVLVMLVSTLVMGGCGTSSGNNADNGNNYDGQLVFDHSMELKYAKLFSVDYYKGGYKLLTITNRDEDTAIVSKQSKILLVPDGMSTPSGVDADTLVLKAPVTNMLVSSTPVTSLMNASNCLSGISQVTYDKKSWYIDAVKKAFDDGKLTYVGDYKAPDYESIIAGSPSLAIYSTMLTSVPDVAAKLKELGVNYILDQSTYEDHPLGRVEWAKLYAALCNEEEAATAMFNEQAAYVDTLSKAENTGKSVAVFYITSKGKLYVRNAGDYLAQMVNIAGGNYIFSDLNPDKTGTQELGGIVVLVRDDYDHLERLGEAEKIVRVMQRMISPAWTEEQMEKNLDFAGQIVENSPVYYLNCTKNPSAVETIKAQIDQMEVEG